MQKIIITLFFKKIAIFCRKSVKIAENSDHNIDLTLVLRPGPRTSVEDLCFSMQQKFGGKKVAKKVLHIFWQRRIKNLPKGRATVLSIASFLHPCESWQEKKSKGTQNEKKLARLIFFWWDRFKKDVYNVSESFLCTGVVLA
jgi:hypothetical protein